ncbi:hypothetical protein V501_00231 [Pseudogymnoascus sp. VKM F-4519 (FW-2642)]|nr:hypothetical protein V501_00231 [Pseudogymnoascus sp. VKM F-4519 (FW-2642)]
MSHSIRSPERLKLPSNALRPDDEDAIQPYFDKEHKNPFVYLPRWVIHTPACAEAFRDTNKGNMYWDAVWLRILMVNCLHKNDDSVLHTIKDAATESLEGAMKHSRALADRLPFVCNDVEDYLVKEWTWKAALLHGKCVNVYMKCHDLRDWKTTPLYHGDHFFYEHRNIHSIREGDHWAQFPVPDDDDICARFVIIEEHMNKEDENTAEDYVETLSTKVVTQTQRPVKRFLKQNRVILAAITAIHSLAFASKLALILSTLSGLISLDERPVGILYDPYLSLQPKPAAAAMPATLMTEPAPMDIGINVALNKYCGIKSAAFALAVIRPDGQISTFVSDDMKTDPKSLFTPEFQNELLKGSGRQPLRHNCEFSAEGTEMQSQTCNNARCRGQINASEPRGSQAHPHSSRSPGGRKRIRANVTRSCGRVVPTAPAVPATHTLPTRTITIGDDAARDDVYRGCLKDMQQNGCKVLGKAWVKLLEPKKQSTYPYTKGASKRPPWWPAMTGPNKIRHKEPDHLHKRERIILLMHILGLVVNQDSKSQARLRGVTVAKLEEVTREAMATWFADREKPKNAEKRPFLTQLFQVLYSEERYRRGELDGSTTVCVNDGAGVPDEEEDDDADYEDEGSDISPQLYQAQPILPTPLSSLPHCLPLPTPPDTTAREDYYSTLTHNQPNTTYPACAWTTQEMNTYNSSAWPVLPAAPSGPMQQQWHGSVLGMSFDGAPKTGFGGAGGDGWSWSSRKRGD